jgi:hypothetical protein
MEAEENDEHNIALFIRHDTIVMKTVHLLRVREISI